MSKQTIKNNINYNYLISIRQHSNLLILLQLVLLFEIRLELVLQLQIILKLTKNIKFY